MLVYMLFVLIYMFYVLCFMLYAMLSMFRSSLSYVFDVRSTCFHVSYHVFVSRSIFSMCCLARSTCFYACLHVYLSFLHALCFMLYAMFRSFFLMCWCLDLHSHMLDIMSLAMPCLDLHVYMHVSMPIYLDLCFHMLVCLGMRSSMPLCLYLHV